MGCVVFHYGPCTLSLKIRSSLHLLLSDKKKERKAKTSQLPLPTAFRPQYNLVYSLSLSRSLKHTHTHTISVQSPDQWRNISHYFCSHQWAKCESGLIIFMCEQITTLLYSYWSHHGVIGWLQIGSVAASSVTLGLPRTVRNHRAASQACHSPACTPGPPWFLLHLTSCLWAECWGWCPAHPLPACSGRWCLHSGGDRTPLECRKLADPVIEIKPNSYHCLCLYKNRIKIDFLCCELWALCWHRVTLSKAVE